MCGIAGVLKLGTNPIARETIIQLILANQSRGGDATGIAMMTEGKLSYHKADEIAWKYVNTDGFEGYLEANLTPETTMVTVHTRAWTVGTPSKNYNNHPLTVGKASVVHNGGIHNHNQLFDELKLKREAETDSDIIRAIVDKEGFDRRALKLLNKMHGSCAAAILHHDYPRQMLVLRSGSPLIMGLVPEEEQILFSSEKKALHLASRLWRKKWGLWAQSNRTNLLFKPMEDNSAWVLDLDAMIEHANDDNWEPPHAEFKTCVNYKAPVYRTHDSFPERQQRKADAAAAEAKEEAQAAKPPANGGKATVKTSTYSPPPMTHAQRGTEELIYYACPNKECNAMVQLKSEWAKIPIESLRCGDCKTPLEPPVTTA